jgi:tRNA-uridine 2-sulfurtransferase
MKTAVALSGGADSLACLVLLKDTERDLLPFHARFFPPAQKDIRTEQQLRKICDALGLEFHILDLARDFEQTVINPFIESYLAGLTPNPCALCNRKIKFGLIFDRVRSLGAGFMATGHYAGISRSGSNLSLWRGGDRAKDQSYFLSMVPVNVFDSTVFPLSEMTKTQALELLRQKNITPPVRAESNEICFIKDDYRKFISGKVPRVILDNPGPVKNKQGDILGRHQGLWRCTQGQRRGLGIAHEHPLYVLGKDYKTNTLIVGSQEELMTRTCRAAGINVHQDPALWPEKVFVQTRYRQKAAQARVDITGDEMLVTFSRPREISAPGQVAAVYSEQGQVLAAGIITYS